MYMDIGSSAWGLFLFPQNEAHSLKKMRNADLFASSKKKEFVKSALKVSLWKLSLHPEKKANN